MMKAVVLALCLFGATATTILPEDHSVPAVSPETVDAVNRAGSTWKAHMSPRFEGMTMAQAKRMLGTIMPNDLGYVDLGLPEKTFKHTVSLPDSFDSRDNWSTCADVIGHIRDQSSCGSCWAFSSTETLNDRRCIVHGEHELRSPEETNDCAGLLYGSMGCNGGQPSGAWQFFVRNGVPTGGDYEDVGAGTTCKPYTLASCFHHGENPDNMTSCSDLPSYSTPSCKKSCGEADYDEAYESDKVYAKTAYTVHGEESLMQEIYENGPVTVAFTVYEDFEAYEGGIYQHVSGKSLGGHAVKMIGWGVENGVKYWSIVNSWNENWGENGLFRIVRGQNECGIEASGWAGEV
mmetsp:Transcript_10704/g.30713  ORF Transcript_10704/g.30713 Transcript_10704/m.30713 type:complete len:348 (-) Transcript_10704:535-1578(-)|eukprot:CAMPEP_0118965552 /NCGR_PEP_ID=MMETSP1173-20130426/3095_1 /TAXON_ID=1034831 /ORGANISM="Rhizochromulina marina cf, Strain CCMP1243" /LENGTH=347 /DNA_ID=CAMNT_0006914195 /DNA_START=27 /DNA_END=1070 /DNA_ORIENTATION=-